MKTKAWMFLVLAMVLFTSWVTPLVKVSAYDMEDSRVNIRHHVEQIAKFMAEEKKNGKFTGGPTAVVGNILNGYATWSMRSNLEEAVDAVLGRCKEKNGGCDRLYSVSIENATSEEIKVYLFHPLETSYSPKNKLWDWSFKPGEKSSLALGDHGEYRIFVPLEMFMMAKCVNINKGWNGRKLRDYNYTVRPYTDGWNVLIRLVPGNEEKV